MGEKVEQIVSIFTDGSKIAKENWVDHSWTAISEKVLILMSFNIPQNIWSWKKI